MELNTYSKPFNSKYYTVHIINKETFRSYLKRLVEIGVITPVQQSQYGMPVFISPMKEGTLRFITDYHRLNHKLVRKLYPSPRMCETMQKLESFHYATALDIDRGYYTISLSPSSQYMTTIVNEFGKSRYNCLPMGRFPYGYISQSKVGELLGDI